MGTMGVAGAGGANREIQATLSDRFGSGEDDAGVGCVVNTDRLG